jgi:hypothetical protein
MPGGSSFSSKGDGPLWLVGGGIGCFCLAALLGPAWSDPTYSSISHTTSELAGQHMPGAWIMRTGFSLFGLGVVLGMLLAPVRPAAVAVPGILFGLSMLAAAIWPTPPISGMLLAPSLEVSARSDMLHSLAASAMGISFCAATAARLWMTQARQARIHWTSLVGLLVAITIPIAMAQLPDFDGALQRIMFGVSFVWVWGEVCQACRAARPDLIA